MNELIQPILTYTILSAASGYVFYYCYKALFPMKEENLPGCGPGCGCDTVKMKKDILEARKLKGL